MFNLIKPTKSSQVQHFLLRLWPGKVNFTLKCAVQHELKTIYSHFQPNPLESQYGMMFPKYCFT